MISRHTPPATDTDVKALRMRALERLAESSHDERMDVLRRAGIVTSQGKLHPRYTAKKSKPQSS